jgi:hypothetical protein
MEQLQVLMRSRPVRIAFFVSRDEHTHPILDAIFQFAFSLWAGRFSLVVPCANGAPLPSYLPWLKAFDPDLIYSYVDMTEAQEAGIHEELYPSALIYHPIGDGQNAARLRPDLPFNPLDVATVLPWAGMPTMLDQGRGVRVIHAVGRYEDDRFVTNNCGASFHLLNALRSRFAPYGNPLILVASDEQERLRPQLRDGEETIPDIPSLLRTMAAHRRDRSLAGLSAMAAPRFSVEDRRWGRSFNLVVGDTPADRIMYWNTRAYVPAWRDGEAVDLCVSPQSLEDPTFVAALAELLARHNLVNDGHGNGPPRITLRSISLTKEQLTPAMNALSSAVKWHAFDCEQIASLEDCTPEPNALTRAGLAVGRSFLQPGLWKEHYVAGPSLRLEAAQPDHLKAIPRELLTPESGAWAVDLDIERSVDHSPYDNVRHRWRLPRRLRVTEAFCAHYQLVKPHGHQVAPRVSGGGLLAVFAGNDGVLPLITLPSDHDAIQTALQRGKNWRPIYDVLRNDAPPEQLCYAIERSDAGQHFFGAYQLFGSLRTARSILLHRFWRQQLERLGATERRANARHDQVLRQIQGRLGDRNLDLKDQKQKEVLANMVLQEADAERMIIRNLSWSKLTADFETLITQHMAAFPREDIGEQEVAKERLSYLSGLRECVQRMCELGILHQGYELRCSKCLHRNWVALGELRTKVLCQVCHHPDAAPVDRSWQFRLNGFLREALQRHGIAPLFWVLARYQREIRSGSLWFEGPLSIYFDAKAYDLKQSASDIDLTIVHDGKVTMCEAKRSTRGFDNPGETAAFFSRLRPDVALIAVMGTHSAALQGKFDEFAAALAGTGIEPRLWTIDEDGDFEDGPWFNI